jgi:hypothetical protein
MKTTTDKIISKLSQESTWRGIIAIATAFGATIDPGRASAIIAAGLTIIGFVNILKKD